MIDLAFALVPVAFFLVAVLAYTAKLLLSGRAHFERVDRLGGSALLSKGLMEMAVWALQPIVRGFIRLGISANGVSRLSLVLGSGAAVALAFRAPWGHHVSCHRLSLAGLRGRHGGSGDRHEFRGWRTR